MARATMVDLIALLRADGNASTTDSFDSVTYWTDDQLQEILDGIKTFSRITIESLDVGDTIFSLDIKRWHKFETDYKVYNLLDVLNTETNTYDHRGNVITFASAETNAIVIEGYSYNMYKALAHLYDRKSAQREFYVELKSGNTKMRLEQEYNHCINRRNYYRGKTAVRTPRVRKNRFIAS